MENDTGQITEVQAVIDELDQAEAVETQEDIQRKAVLQEYEQLYTFMNTALDSLSKREDFQEKKQVILQNLINAFKTFKKFQFNSEESRKIVKRELKKRILQDENIFTRLKLLILLRDRDRSTREYSIKVLKKLINFSKKCCQMLFKLKLEIFISFILEREYKHAQVLKERLQCFKLIKAWLERDPKTLPYIFGQTVASISKNPEDSQLRKKCIELILSLCQKRPDMGASVGGIKIMVDTLLDVSMFQQGIIKYDLIVHSLLLMINSPDTRVYLRHFKDLNRIFSIFT